MKISLRIPGFVLMMLFFACFQNAHAQIQVTPGLTPQQIASNLFGSGISNVNNVTYIGAQGASGIFSPGAIISSLGINNGLLLTTGSATIATGVNTMGGAGLQNHLPGDAFLQAMVPGALTYDASAITFNFTPLSDTLYIRYVFGSEEYPEYVGSSFNDCFGLLLSGPNPNGGNYSSFNMANIPGTILPVSINNINNGSSNTGPCVNCQYFINNMGGVFLQYDGYTTVFTAWARVTPGVPYSMRIVIADAGDEIMDSGVFLEEHSFYCGSVNVLSAYTMPGVGNYAIEGCSDAVIDFAIPNPAVDTFWIVFDTIMGTASNGVDFQAIPDSICILPGQKTTALIISPYVDYTTEGNEFISIVIPVSQWFSDTITINIKDYFPVSLNVMGDTSIACGDSVMIGVQPSNGIPPYVFSWTPAITLSDPSAANPIAFPSSTTTYVVAVHDSLGCSSQVDSVVVEITIIMAQPQNQQGSIGDDAHFSVSPAKGLASYQWQTDTGNGFYDLMNSGQYEGALSNELVVSNLTAANHNQRFRCVVTMNTCSDISDPAIIQMMTSIEEPNVQPLISLYPNPVHDCITLTVSEAITDGTWTLVDVTGRIIKSGTVAYPGTSVNIEKMDAGILLLIVKSESCQTLETFRVVKK